MFITSKTATYFRIYINTHSPSQCQNHRICTVGFSRLGLMYLRIILVPVELFSAIVTKHISYIIIMHVTIDLLLAVLDIHTLGLVRLYSKSHSYQQTATFVHSSNCRHR